MLKALGVQSAGGCAPALEDADTHVIPRMKMAFLTAAPLIQPDETAGVVQSFERAREMYSLSLVPVKAPSAILMAADGTPRHA